MKTVVLICAGIALLIFSVILVNSSRAENKTSGSVLRHVVLFTFTPEATQEQIDNIVKEFQKLPSRIKEIKDFEWGTDNSPEKLSKGHTHCFLVTFATEADRDAYLPHPEHLKFVAQLKPLLKDVTVVDYWSKN
jgi:hypothetical protein